jgi:alpha-1,3-glucosyltransferase
MRGNPIGSMWPLLKKDGQGIQYVATLLLWNRLLGYNPFRFKMSDHSFVTFLSLVCFVLTRKELDLMGG